MRIVPVIFAITVLGPVACGGSGGGPSGPAGGLPLTASVTTVAGNPPSFSPRFVEVGAGGTVTWRINVTSPLDHTVTSTTGAWAPSAVLEAGDSFSVTFPQAGSFPYECTIHPGMTGSVTVR